MSGVWIRQDVSNHLRLKHTFERNVKDQWITEWRSLLSCKSSCNAYVSYKDSFTLENYLIKLPKLYKFTLCRLRTNNHRFPVVTGRYNRTPREERICNKCNDNVIGDEYHVLLECTCQEIAQLRIKYLPVYYRNRPTRYKFVKLLQNSRYTIQCKVALFGKSIFSIFR